MTDDAAVEQNLKQTRAKNLKQAKKDVLAVFQNFTALACTTETFAFPKKKPSSVAALIGTIPVDYKGNQYHIPIAVYLSHKHPQVAPHCYVKPTNQMRIKKRDYVDDSGKIDVPYLTDWKHPRDDLTGLLHVLSITFGEECPVYSISSQSSFDSPAPESPISRFSTYVNVPKTAAVASFLAPSATSTVKPEHLKESMVTALEHQMKLKLKDRFYIHAMEMASMKQTYQDLLAGNEKVQAIIEKLKNENYEVEASLQIYKKAKADFEKKLIFHSTHADQTIDNVIDASTPVHRQLVDAYAADCAIDDAIYALGQAVKNGSLDVQAYLKHVRQLSRRQFVHRLIIRKCRLTARLK
ncbi:hypothetical protein L596_030407 [Steinernema carpocapsae]|uniref:UEV domain-containing protein n=1 Tax=Steinernema carpocapsae TaxID=34508 RepID=A0A4U5LPA4_STECR|nr:hypothetical protein L596_030407 [Steinernema carpocapsae]